MIDLIKINIIYLLIFFLIILNLYKYNWKPIISNNFLFKIVFFILKIFNLKVSIIIIFILNLIIFYIFYNKDIFKIKNILIFILLKLIIDQFIKYFIKNKYKIPRPYILYINNKFNLDIDKFIMLFESNKIELLYKSFNKILNIDNKYNLINNYYSLISGHSLLLLNIFNIYYFTFYKFKKTNLLLVFSIINILLLYSRIFLGMHFFIDIILSIMLNFISLIIIILIFYYLNINLII